MAKNMLTRLIHTITRVLLAVAAAVLSMMMFLTAADVVMRYIFNRPISGAFEVAEFMMALIVPFSIAYCAEQKGHVTVDLFIRKFPNIFQKGLGFFTSLLTMLFAVLVSWQNVMYIGETYRDHLTSSVLLIPAYPFIVPISIGIGVYTLVIMLQTFTSGQEV